MKFSLVMATLGRSTEVERLFNSLVAQSHQDFELIVIDQNDDQRVLDLVEKFSSRLKIIYLRSEKGLSRARNVGLEHIDGELVAFPDDDCWYAPHLLSYVAAHFERESALSGVTGCSISADEMYSQGRWGKEAVIVNRSNVFTCATSYTIFLRRAAAQSAGKFDEALGVGSGTKWGAGEEVNFLLGVLAAGALVRYDPELRVFHPEPIKEMNEKAFSRARLYNRGFGRVLGLKKYPAHVVIYHVARAMAGSVLSMARLDLKRAKYYRIAATQRLLGWLD